MGDRSKVSMMKMEQRTRLSAMSHQLSARFVLRVIVGFVFVASGLAKMWDIYGFSKIVSGYGVLPEGLVVPVSIIIPFIEFVLGVMVLVNFHVRTASLGLLAMVVIFTGFSAMKYFSGGASDCECFGDIVERKISWSFFAQNLALVLGLTITKNKKSEGLLRSRSKNEPPPHYT